MQLIQRRSFALALALSLLATGCASTGGGMRSAAFSQVREVEHFSKIEANGPLDLMVRVGSAAGLSVRADESSMAELISEVRDGRLVISYPRDASTATLQVTLPHLFELSCSGGARAKLRGLRGGTLKLDLAGNGSIWAEGTIERLTGSIDGPGSLELAGLATRFADVKVRGSGDAEVHVSGSLDAVVEGGGGVLYHGDPIVNADTSGSGKVAPRR